ncbi:RDD family protein [Paraburkholderia sp. UCT31]|uniref:RDD family protein n=1 Tax=Paraburkholderia sp. UCT31 TaxID=2615209 RepID=UPI001655C7DC|nr:RDD family protein [Paraburkholderia sp. UCT31]
MDTGEASESTPKSAVETEATNPSAMTRFYARMFDLTLWSFLVGYPLAYVLGLCVPVFAAAVDSQLVATVLIVTAVFVLVSLPVNLCFDALVYRWFGNTPGKALLSLSVRTTADERLSPAQYMKRNFAMWAPGFGFGLPLVSMVALGASGHSLKQTGATRWDREGGYRVVGTRRQAWRVGVFIVLGLLMTVISRMEGQEAAKSLERLLLAQPAGNLESENSQPITPPQTTLTGDQPVAMPAPPVAVAVPTPIAPPVATAQSAQAVTWKNPISGLPAQFDARWSENRSLEGSYDSWVFVSAGGDEVVSVDSAPVYDLMTNGQVVRLHQSDGPVVSIQRIVESGRDVWEGQGVGSLDLQNRALNPYVDTRGVTHLRTYARIWAFKGSGGYWRVTYAADVATPQNEKDSHDFFTAVLNSTRRDQEPDPAEGPNGSALTWLNPVSGQAVRLDARWHRNPFLPDKQNPWAFGSLHCASSAGPCSGGEEQVGVRYFPDEGTSSESLQAYAQAMHAAGDPIYPLLVNSHEVVESGRRVWEGEATGDAGLVYHATPEFVRFWLFRGNGGFWRVSYSAEAAFPRAEKDAENFFHAVLSTTTP